MNDQGQIQGQQISKEGAPIALFGFALIIVGFTLLGVALIAFIVNGKQTRLEEVCATTASLIENVKSQAVVTPAPTATPSATITPTKSYYNYYSPTPARQ